MAGLSAAVPLLTKREEFGYSKSRPILQNLAKLVLKSLMWLIFLVWVAAIFFHPTEFMRKLLSNWIKFTRGSIFGITGSIFLGFSAPIIVIAFLAYIYVAIFSGENFEKRSYKFPKYQLWTFPVLVDGPFGVVSAAEMIGILLFGAYVLWSVTIYAIQDHSLIERFSLTLKEKRKLKMGSFNPLAAILKDYKLTGPNFVTWKRNLDIVLTSDDYKFVLTEPCPPAPSKDSPEMDDGYYELWKKADRMTTCYMLASMSDVLQSQHQSMASAADIMLNLTEMFGGQGRAARQIAMKALMNTNMAEGTPVRDHVLKMIDLLNEMEVLGAEIDGETQIDIVLQSLPDSFNQFRLNYTMNKLDFSLAELLKELQAAEGVIRKSTQVFVAERASSSRPSIGKKKKKGQQQKNTKGVGKVKPSLAKAKAPKGKCFYCQKSGHWKRDCPDRKNKEATWVPGDQAAQ